MLFIFMGPSCSGKSSVADEIKKMINAKIFTGRDYLRMAKNKDEAWMIFKEKLALAAAADKSTSNTIIYIISEIGEALDLQTIDNKIRIKFYADLDTLKSRFKLRLRRDLPQPIEKMLERQLNEWETVTADLTVDTSQEGNLAETAKKILKLVK